MPCCLYCGEYGSEMRFRRIKILGGKCLCKKCKELMDFDRKDNDRLPVCLCCGNRLGFYSRDNDIDLFSTIYLFIYLFIIKSCC
jgi:hypothetical protein